MKKDGTIAIQGKDITVKGSGAINVKATKDIVMKGKKILQNWFWRSRCDVVLQRSVVDGFWIWMDSKCCWYVGSVVDNGDFWSQMASGDIIGILNSDGRNSIAEKLL